MLASSVLELLEFTHQSAGSEMLFFGRRRGKNPFLKKKKYIESIIIFLGSMVCFVNMIIL